MVFCKLCGKQVKVHNKIDMDIYLWNHMKTKHRKEFKEDENELIEDIFGKYFSVDNPESDIAVRTQNN